MRWRHFVVVGLALFPVLTGGGCRTGDVGFALVERRVSYSPTRPPPREWAMQIVNVDGDGTVTYRIGDVTHTAAPGDFLAEPPVRVVSSDPHSQAVVVGVTSCRSFREYRLGPLVHRSYD